VPAGDLNQRHRRGVAGGLMAGWILTWRVVLHWDFGSPDGASIQVRFVDTVAELRSMIMWARRDPRIGRYSYARHRVFDETAVPTACARGHRYVPVGIRDVQCLCGGHRTLRCLIHPDDVVVCPPYDAGCGPIPTDRPDNAPG
jgi:hypothetical protein